MSRRPAIKALQRATVDAEGLGCRCSECPLKLVHNKQPINPQSDPRPGPFILRDSPSKYDVKVGRPVPSASSRFLERTLNQANAHEGTTSYALLCDTFGAKDNEIKEAVRCCKPRLDAELDQARALLNPGERQWLLSLGQQAFSAATGKLSSQDAWLGSPIEAGPLRSVVPAHAPDYVLSKEGRRYGGVFQKHVERAAMLADGRLEAFEWPENVVDDCTAALEKIATAAETGAEVSIDIETRGLGLDSAISCIGFASEQSACCIQLPLCSVDDALVRRILRTGIMVGQNIAFDRGVLAHHGYELTPLRDCTMLAASILDPQLKRNLGALTSAEFHAEAHKAEFHSDVESGVLTGGIWGSTDPKVERNRRIYCLRDSYVTYLLWQRQKQRLQHYGQAHYERLKAKGPVAAQMASRGMVWDAAKAARLKKYHSGKADKIVAQMRKVVGPEFNPGSTAQLRKLFYETCKVAPFAWTDGGKPSTNEDVLTELLKSDNAFVVSAAQKVGEYRNHIKMVGTYIEGAKPLPGQTKVYGNWKPHTAVTGRWSCTKFDDGVKEWGCPFQVVPERMRRLFRAQPGMELMEADYAGLELRTLVLLSGAKHYEQMIADGVDMHLMNARQMFDMPDMPKKHPMRKATKVLSFLSHYMGGPQTAWKGLVADEDIQKWMKERGRVLTLREVEAMQRAYFKIHPEIPVWWKRNIEEANQRGYYLEPIFGRRVYFYGPADVSFCQNFPNQSLGAEICDRAMMRIWPQLRQPEEGFVVAVHDALGLEGPDGKRLEGLAQEHMPTTLTYEGRTMHFPIECKIAERYVRVK